MDREFRTQTVNGKFIIAEQTVSRWGNVSRELAWKQARSQANPVIVIDTEGNERELGDAFDAAVWEQTMYVGHVSYELSMTDGHYAPEDFDRWVHWFRAQPTTRNIDASPATLDAINRYLASR